MAKSVVAFSLEEFDPTYTRVLIGNANFRYYDFTNLGTLELIQGGADFFNSGVKSLGNLTTIGGYAIFQNSKIQDLGNLTTINGNADFRNSQVEDLGNLTEIGGDADFSYANFSNLGNLTEIGGDADFSDSKIQNLGNLTTIVGNAYFSESQVKSLGNLTTIGGYVNFTDSQVEDLGNLTTIGGNAYFTNSQIESLGNLQTILGNANFRDSQIKDLGQLTTIGGDADFLRSSIQDLGNLTTIDGSAYFNNSQVKNLGNLTTIGQDTNFQFSELKDLGNLITIGGTAVFGQSEIKDLGNLTTIGRDANFYQSQIMDLRNLETIGRNAYFNDSEVKSLGNLRTILGNADFWDSQVENLGNLTTIGGYVAFGNRTDLEAEWEKISNKDNFKTGGQPLSKTPAPKKDRVYGSKKNKPESSKDTKSAEKIEFNEKTLETIKNKVAEHNENNPKKKVTLASAKAVVRRGMGAYSSTHRPTISGGKPNSRVAWGLARLNAFFYKIINGKSKSGKYIQDDDLINELGYKVAKYVDGGLIENELNKIKESYEFGSEYFDGKIYGQEYKIRMNKNHPRNSYRNDDQTIHNLSLVNVEYPSAVVFRENYGKLQYQYDKIFDWKDAKEKIEDFFYEIKDRSEDYANGGLIAPNGKPSNLTPEQYKLVRTKAFKDWFGDWENDPENASKIVDENGEPLPVYHGSRSKFDIFDIQKSGESNTTSKVGFWFTSIKMFAENFANSIWYGKSENEVIYSVFLSVKNPKIYESEIISEKQKDKLRLKISDLQNESRSIQKKWVTGDWDYKDRMVLDASIRGSINEENFNDYLNLSNKSKDAINDGILISDINKKIKNIENKLYGLTYNDSYEKFRTDIYKVEGKNSEQANMGGLGMALSDPNGTIKKYVNSLKNKGNDGIIIKKTRFDKSNAGGLNDQYVAFEPNQIKLADGTNTTFDSNNPDIRFMAGGQVLNLNKIRKGQYEAKSDKIEISLTNPKVLNGMGTNKWQLIIEYSNDIIVNQWFDTMNEALKTGAILLSDFLDSNNTETRFMAGGVPKKFKFDIEENEGVERTEISINGVGKVILVMTYPEYEFMDDIGEDGLEELGVEEGEIIGKIEHIKIEDDFKGKGYAKLLMKKAIEIAEEKGLMPLYLNASPMGNKGLNINDLTAFYESFGFEIFLEQGNNNLMILK